MLHLLAQSQVWRPFLDPLDLHAVWWLFLLPLALGISVAYKAVRMPTLDGYVRAVVIMTVQIVVAMILLGVASFLVIGYVLPNLVPMAE